MVVCGSAQPGPLVVYARRQNRQGREKKFSVNFFAHRGLHTGMKNPENSIAAFKRAGGFGAGLMWNLDGDGTSLCSMMMNWGVYGAKGKLTTLRGGLKTQAARFEQKYRCCPRCWSLRGVPLIVG